MRNILFGDPHDVKGGEKIKL